MEDEPRSAGERFSRKQVCRILGFTQRQLSGWERMGLVQPRYCIELPHKSADGADEALAISEDNSPAIGSTQTGAKVPNPTREAFYSFDDIVALKRLVELHRSGVPPARLRMANEALKERQIEKPWSRLQIKNAGKDLVVHVAGGLMEPVTGQFLLEYSGREKPSGDAKLTVRPFKVSSRRSAAEKKIMAERFFAAALRCEERGAPAEKTIRAYQKALELNPEAIGAYINLGTIYYNLGQLDAAESCYQAALTLDAGYGLVHFNLGNVADERNDLHAARKCYEEAIRCEPSYPDPHYNLALVYEKLGLPGKARQCWLKYLKLDQSSHWAAFARLQLEKTPFRLVEPPAKKMTGEPS